jgi:5-methylcytosine-specific restriction endonuclease McrA
MKLSIEMIPKTCWFKNLRKSLKQSDWDKIRKEVYAKENMNCHICKAKFSRLEAHEVWEFDEKNHIQKLVNIIGVCSDCHNVIHFGLSQIQGRAEKAIDQFMKVNKCDIFEFDKHAKKAKSDYDRRSKINDWKLDVSLIEKQGYVIKKD